MTRHPMLAAVFLALAMMMPAQAFASGIIGPSPIEPRKFRDFAACRAYLEEQHDSDQTAVGNMSAGDGRTMPQRSLESKEVVRTGDRVARYEAVLGYLSKTVDEERKAIRSQYSYEEKKFVCNDGMLTGTQTSGYHLENYEPLE